MNHDEPYLSRRHAVIYRDHSTRLLPASCLVLHRPASSMPFQSSAWCLASRPMFCSKRRAANRRRCSLLASKSTVHQDFNWAITVSCQDGTSMAKDNHVGTPVTRSAVPEAYRLFRALRCSILFLPKTRGRHNMYRIWGCGAGHAFSFLSGVFALAG